MQITVRDATTSDIPAIVELYAVGEAEQTAKKPIWALTDAIDDEIPAQIADAIAADESWFRVGCIDDVPVGFIWATLEPMLARAGGERTGRIRLVFTDPDARGVGVGHAMLESILGTLREQGIRHFDAPVGPGQRLTKNFFEGHEFAARSIIMYHADTDE